MYGMHRHRNKREMELSWNCDNLNDILGAFQKPH